MDLEEQQKIRDEISAFAKNNNLSLTKIARLAGMDCGNFRRWIKGERNFCDRNLQVLKGWLENPFQEIPYGKAPPHNINYSRGREFLLNQGKLKDTTFEAYYQAVLNLSETELSLMWQHICEYGGIKEICSEYDLDINQFGGWLYHQGHNSRKIVQAVRSFILFKKINFFLPHISLNEAINNVINRREGLKSVIFIDGDGACRFLDSLRPFVPPIEPYEENYQNRFPIHVIISLRKGLHVSRAIGFEYRVWFDTVHTLTKGLNAADTLVTSQVTLLHQFLPLDVEFFIVSNDGFIEELVVQVSTTRKCHSIHNESLWDIGARRALHIL